MIKVTTKANIKSPKAFPKIMKGNITGILVLFNNPVTGMVIDRAKHSLWREGEIKSTWYAADFEDYNKPVTLESI